MVERLKETRLEDHDSRQTKLTNYMEVEVEEVMGYG